MRLILPFDTETSGVPLWNLPSELPEQPHIFQLAALLVSEDTREIKESMDVIIRPDGWTSSAEAFAKHGITHERAMDEGIPEADAIAQFLDMHARAGLRIGHSVAFDNRILRIALKRYRDDAIADAFKEAPSFCTGHGSRAMVGTKKMPTLQEAYTHFTGEPFENAHSAMADTKACLAVYWGIVDQKAAA